MLKNNTIPKRKKESHKGDYGRLVIMAGSSGMAGAAILASRGALRSGAGIVYLAVPTQIKDIINLATPEVIVKKINEIAILDHDVLAIGPGLTTSPNIKKIVKEAIMKSKVPLILDADALNVLENESKILSKSKCEIIVTPHPKEMSRLTGLDLKYIQKNRISVAKKFSKEWGACVVLKGSGTVIADKLGDVYINKTGNPGMATCGVGDVLLGVISALVAQKFSMFDAACTGVYLHGLAADMAAKIKGEYSLIATDIIDFLPNAFLKVQNAL